MTAVDDNGVGLMYGVSHVDGVTPVVIAFNPVNRAMKVDTTTTIGFDPAITASKTANDRSLLKATSSSDNVTALPLVVNASTGGVLISTT